MGAAVVSTAVLREEKDTWDKKHFPQMRAEALQTKKRGRESQTDSRPLFASREGLIPSCLQAHRSTMRASP